MISRDAAWWCRPAARASRSTRCDSSVIVRRAGRVTRSPGPRPLRGAAVTLVSANVELPDVAGATTVRVQTAAELQAAVVDAAGGV